VRGESSARRRERSELSRRAKNQGEKATLKKKRVAASLFNIGGRNKRTSFEEGKIAKQHRRIEVEGKTMEKKGLLRRSTRSSLPGVWELVPGVLVK